MFCFDNWIETKRDLMNAGSFAPALALNADFRPLNYFRYHYGHGRMR